MSERTVPSPRRLPRERRLGFTLVEMLVVISIITVLIGIVLIAGRSFLQTAQEKDTRLMLTQLQGAINAFADADPYSKVAVARKRYGPNPPDDLMAYSTDPEYGTGTIDIGMPKLMPGGQGNYFFMQAGADITDDLGDSNYVPLGDIKALCWALQQTPTSRELYRAIPERFRKFAPPEEEFFDMNGNDQFDQLIDKQVEHLVDGWQQPLSYYNVRAFGTPPGTQSISNEQPTSHGWVARELLRINADLPVVVSYGADGPNQLSAQETLEHQYNKRVVDGLGSTGEPVFDSTYQLDNLYSNPAINDRLSEITIPGITGP